MPQKNPLKLVYQEALKMKADIYHLHDPELFLIAAKIKLVNAKDDKPFNINHPSFIQTTLKQLVDQT